MVTSKQANTFVHFAHCLSVLAIVPGAQQMLKEYLINERISISIRIQSKFCDYREWKENNTNPFIHINVKSYREFHGIISRKNKMWNRTFATY